MTRQIRILIVDCQPRTRQSLRALLATWPEIGEIQEAKSGVEAVQLVESLCPDLVLMGMRLPDLDGLDATRLIKKRWSHVKIIVLSSYADYEADALAAGADAFVHKGEPPDRLVEALAAVMSRSASDVVPCRD
jgi:DNA-binding NarL/FixJ family response regulator